MNVYSKTRKVKALKSIDKLKLNCKNKKDGLKLLKQIPDNSISLVFFDPQYRSVLTKMKYGNEGSRQKARNELQTMSNELINEFILEIERVLIPSGHLALWVDKYILCNGREFLNGVDLQLVDMMTWNKDRMGMGYRTRRFCEFLIFYQKKPVRAKGIWSIHNIPDIWTEKITNKTHTHQKPIELQKRIIEAITNENDIVVDPCAGSYSVMKATKQTKRNFLGCDLG